MAFGASGGRAGPDRQHACGRIQADPSRAGKPILRGPEWALQAQWFLRDGAGNSCRVRLDPAPLGENRFMTTLGKDCNAEMARIAAWRLQGDTVLLVDSHDTVIGRFRRSSWMDYPGRFTLANGTVTEASLARL